MSSDPYGEGSKANVFLAASYWPLTAVSRPVKSMVRPVPGLVVDGHDDGHVVAHVQAVGGEGVVEGVVAAVVTGGHVLPARADLLDVGQGRAETSGLPIPLVVQDPERGTDDVQDAGIGSADTTLGAVAAQKEVVRGLGISFLVSDGYDRCPGQGRPVVVHLLVVLALSAGQPPEHVGPVGSGGIDVVDGRHVEGAHEHRPVAEVE